jgi:hypothetical protein
MHQLEEWEQRDNDEGRIEQQVYLDLNRDRKGCASGEMRLSAPNTKLSTEEVCLYLGDADWQTIMRQLSRKEIQRSKIAKGSSKEASLIGTSEVELHDQGAYLGWDDAN